MLLKIFFEVEVEVLFVVFNIEDLMGFCDKVMFELLYVIGLCVIELVGLRME